MAAGETNLRLIGNAVLVDGSRPDVATISPSSPRSTRGGWGYLLLTNSLPNLGNGTFRLSVFAADPDGHNSFLGTTTITVANASAVTPFGAIDTPGQGEVVSGASYANFGWVLSPAPALAYPPFGTVSVVVDGVFQSVPPGGWTSRPDLTALFPALSYPGITNALGVATLNTTTMTNGLHTIAWVVTDSRPGRGHRQPLLRRGNTGTAWRAPRLRRRRSMAGWRQGRRPARRGQPPLMPSWPGEEGSTRMRPSRFSARPAGASRSTAGS